MTQAAGNWIPILATGLLYALVVFAVPWLLRLLSQ